MTHEFERFNKWLRGWGIEPVYFAPPLGLILLLIIVAHDGVLGWYTTSAFIFFLPFWLPFALARFFWVMWIEYIRYQYFFRNPEVLLEIFPPPEVEKSPLAMEVFISALWYTSNETTFVDRVWLGKYRPIWSLEIASTGGRVSFYLHLRESFRQMVEARLYGQFPEAKIVEVPDYASKVPFNTDDWDLFGMEFRFDRPAAYPIKTYVDWGLDKDPDEELKVDPLSNVLELLGSIGKKEHFWIQIIIRAQKGTGREWYGFEIGENVLKEQLRAEIQTLMKGAVARSQAIVGGDEEKLAKAGEQAATRGLVILSDGEKRKIEMMEKKIGKIIFETGIRSCYLARKEDFNSSYPAHILRFFESFRSEEFNAIRSARGMNDFDYPWQDFLNIRHRIVMRRMFKRYYQRAYFMVPYDQRGRLMRLGPDELATIWHFPSSIIKTPGLTRVAARRSEGPPNLPTLPS